jgi:hypothetical protein
MHHLPVVADDEHGAWNLLLGDGVVDDGVENGEAGIKRSLRDRGARKQQSERQQKFQ